MTLTDTDTATLDEAPIFKNVPKPLGPLDLTDEMLMARIQVSDPDALAQLHDRYASMLKAVIIKVLHNDAEAEDMLQEVFVEIWNRAGSYCAEKGKPLGWIITLTRRRSIDRLRKRDAYCRAEDRLAEETKNTSATYSGRLDEEIAHAEMRDVLRPVLDSLPIAQKQAIEFAFYKGMSQREIAAHTGIPLGTIKTRLELGLRKVADALRGFEDLL